MNHTNSQWERARSRRRLHIQHPRWLTHRFREQARSHKGQWRNTNIMNHTNSLWERASSGRRSDEEASTANTTAD